MKKLIILCALMVISMGAYSQARLYSIKSIDSLKLIIDGNTEHTFTIGKHKTDTSDVDIIIYQGSDIENSFYTQSVANSTFAPIANGVSNGNSHDHSGGDGAQINHTTLSNIGTNTHAQIDNHISDNSNPHGSTLTQTTLVIGGTIYSTQGTITSTSTTTVLTISEDDYAIYLLTFTGEQTDYATTFNGFNAYLCTGQYNTYTSSFDVGFIKLGEESYSGRVVVSKSGYSIRLQSSQADPTHPLYWRILRLR